MKPRFVLIAGLILFALIASACDSLSPARPPIPTIFTTPIAPTQIPIIKSVEPGRLAGRWQIVKYEFAPISAMDKSQADTWLNKSAEIKTGSVTFDGKTCAVSQFDLSNIDTSKYFLVEFKTDPTKIGIKEPRVIVAGTGCANTPFRNIMQLTDTSIVFFWDGVFFFLAPATTTQPVATAPAAAVPTSAPKRINFAAGAISASVPGSLVSNAVDRYVLRASAGQTLTANLDSAQSQAVLMISGADGVVLISDNVGTTYWTGRLPKTQDYFIDAKSIAFAPVNYTLQVTIPPLPTPGADAQPAPKRITFAPNTISATVQGSLTARGVDHYILGAQAGQTLSVSAVAPQVYLVIYGVDGNVLMSDHAGSSAFTGKLPTTQDYIVHVRSYSDAPSNYSLTVTIPPNPPPTPAFVVKRISFPPGGTTASVGGELPANGMHRWQLRAQAGQTMQVGVIPTQGQVLLIIFGADGNVLISDHAGATNWRGKLPTTQDYNIDVRAYGNAPATYNLVVTIPPK